MVSPCRDGRVSAAGVVAIPGGGGAMYSPLMSCPRIKLVKLAKVGVVLLVKPVAELNPGDDEVNAAKNHLPVPGYRQYG